MRVSDQHVGPIKGAVLCVSYISVNQRKTGKRGKEKMEHRFFLWSVASGLKCYVEYSNFIFYLGFNFFFKVLKEARDRDFYSEPDT